MESTTKTAPGNLITEDDPIVEHNELPSVGDSARVVDDAEAATSSDEGNLAAKDQREPDWADEVTEHRNNFDDADSTDEDDALFANVLTEAHLDTDVIDVQAVHAGLFAQQVNIDNLDEYQVVDGYDAYYNEQFFGPITVEEIPASELRPRHAGKIAVAFGIAILLVGGVGAVANVLQLIQNPPQLIAYPAAPVVDPTLALTDTDVEAQPVAQIEAVQTARVITGARVRSGATQGAGVLGAVSAESLVLVTGPAQNDWYPIAQADMEGWVWGQLLTDFQALPVTDTDVVNILPEGFIPADAGEAVAADDAVDVADDEPLGEPTADDAAAEVVGQRTAIQRVYLRPTPTTANQPITVVDNGAIVEVTGPEFQGWLPIIYNGQPGWSAVHAFR